MQTSLGGGIFTATSKGLEITVLPGEGDELFMIFDERSPTNYTPGILLFVFSALAALGATEDRGALFGLFVLLSGMLMASVALYFAKQSGEREQAQRDGLFASLGGLLHRSATKIRVIDEDDASAEVGVDIDAPNTKKFLSG